MSTPMAQPWPLSSWESPLETVEDARKAMHELLLLSAARVSAQELTRFANSILRVALCDSSLLIDLASDLVHWIAFIAQTYLPTTKDDPLLLSLLILLIQVIFSQPGAAVIAVNEIRKGALKINSSNNATSSNAAADPTGEASTASASTSASASASVSPRTVHIESDSFLVSASLLRQVATFDSYFNYNVSFALDAFLQYVSNVVCSLLDALTILKKERTSENPDSIKALYVLSDLLRYSGFFSCATWATQDDAKEMFARVREISDYNTPSFVMSGLMRNGNFKDIQAWGINLTLTQTSDLKFAYSFLIEFLDHESECEILHSKCIPTFLLLATNVVHERTSDTREVYNAFNEAKTKLSVNSFCCMFNYAVCCNIMRTFALEVPAVISEKFESYELPPLAKWGYLFNDESFIPDCKDRREINLTRLGEVLTLNLDSLLVTLERELHVLLSFEVDSLKLLANKLILARICTCFHSMCLPLLLLEKSLALDTNSVFRVLQQKVHQSFAFILELNIAPNFAESGWILLINLASDICYDSLQYTSLFEKLFLYLLEKDAAVVGNKPIMALLNKFSTVLGCPGLAAKLGIPAPKMNLLDMMVSQAGVSKLLGIQKPQCLPSGPRKQH